MPLSAGKQQFFSQGSRWGRRQEGPLAPRGPHGGGRPLKRALGLPLHELVMSRARARLMRVTSARILGVLLF